MPVRPGVSLLHQHLNQKKQEESNTDFGIVFVSIVGDPADILPTSEDSGGDESGKIPEGTNCS